jgi:hypothetical protein
MLINGYKYINEQDAIDARKQCANYYGLPTSPENVTKYWVDYEIAQLDEPIFWYIVYDSSIEVVLGKPTTFEVNIY